MNTGFGISEILLVATIIVVFFGSKELPKFLREIARLTARVRRYSDRIKRELDDVTRSLDPKPEMVNEQREQKKKLRTYYLAARKELSKEQREEKSVAIHECLLNRKEVKDAVMVMLYIDMGAEVSTRILVNKLLEDKKRVVLPYCTESGGKELRAAEIHHLEDDLVIGKHNIPEPREELRKHLFKSDLGVIICPGVAYDPQGGRLGRGKGYYDNFLREMRGKIPIIGLAYDCQMMKETLPFEYHDVPMDLVITESGVAVGESAEESPSSSLAG